MSILPWIGGDDTGQLEENLPPSVDRSHDVEALAEAEDEEELEELEEEEVESESDSDEESVPSSGAFCRVCEKPMMLRRCRRCLRLRCF